MIARKVGVTTQISENSPAMDPVARDTLPMLCELAAEEGVGRQTDVAELARIARGTVSRLWSDPAWFESITTQNLIALARVLPALAAYLHAQPHVGLQQAQDELVSKGAEVHVGVVDRLLTEKGVNPAHLASALRAASRLLDCEDDTELLDTCGVIALFWQRTRGVCFHHLVSADGDDALVNSTGAVIERAQRLLQLLTSRKAGKGPALKVDRARQVLIHYLSTDDEAVLTPAKHIRNYAAALDLRCNLTRRLVREDDHDLVRWYRVRVETDPLAQLIEAWMFPAWTGDYAADRSPTRPRRVLLGRTAQEVLREIEDPRYSDAYLSYLLTIYLPIALTIDPTFGDSSHLLAPSLERRFETQAPSPALEEASAKLTALR